MIALLMLELKQALEQALTGRYMPRNEAGKPFGVPVVCLGALPPKERKGEAEPFPFVVIRWTGGEDSQADLLDEITLVVGVYGQEHGEHEIDAVNLAWAVRAALLGHRSIRLWQLELPIRSRQPPHEQQPHPYSVATISTKWRTSAPEEPVEDIDD